MATSNDNWWKSSALKIFVSHALSSWGDRMWTFAVGLYMVFLSPGSLQLTAIYGFLTSISAILLGAFIGRWVDKTERLRAAQVGLLVQNSSVVICAVLLVLYLHFREEMQSIWDGALGVILIILVILFAIIANLASIATQLVLEKDWIVVLSGGDDALLSKMNATMRTINLTTAILAPILVGQLFTFGSHIIAAAFIAGWNIVSGGLEYTLLIIIYKSIPELSMKKKLTDATQSSLDQNNQKYQNEPAENAVDNMPTAPSVAQISTISNSAHLLPITGAVKSDQMPKSPITSTLQNGLAIENLSVVSLITPTSQVPTHTNVEQSAEVKPKPVNFFRKNITSLKVKFEESRVGWMDYFTHPVRDAGLGLAFLYMTVLGFDSITTGYAYGQGVSESIIGIVTAVGAVFGILGSLSFPFLRKKLGKLVTGNIGFGSETICLIFCLVSIVTPGSPFIHNSMLSLGDTSFNCTLNFTGRIDSETSESYSISELWNCNISVFLLLFGIVAARFGLWLADLSVVQIFQERIPEDKRGILNGVQGALNQTMNLIKFIMVIILPKSDTFAYLIVASWLFVFFGWVFFMAYSWNNRRARVLSSTYSAKIHTVSDSVQEHDKSARNEINETYF